MKKTLILLLASILVIGSFTACGAKESAEGDAAAAKEVKIGINYELTGAGRYIRRSFRRWYHDGNLMRSMLPVVSTE